MSKGKQRTTPMKVVKKLSKQEKEDLVKQEEARREEEAKNQENIQKATEEINAICEKYGVTLSINAPTLLEIMRVFPQAMQSAGVVVTPVQLNTQQG